MTSIEGQRALERSCRAEHEGVPSGRSRQLRRGVERRRFERAVGYGPATLVRIQRFQHFLALAEDDPDASLVRLALEAGYADQAHLTRESTRLSGLPPAALLRDGAGAAGDRSVSFKPGGAEWTTLAA